MDREASFGIASPNEQGYDAGGITAADGVAKPQLRLSQRGHGAAPELAFALRPRPRARPRPTEWRMTGCRCPTRSMSASDRSAGPRGRKGPIQARLSGQSAYR